MTLSDIDLSPSLIGREVMVMTSLVRQGWISELDDEGAPLVCVYEDNGETTLLQDIDISIVELLDEDTEAPDGFHAIDIQSMDGKPLCSIRTDDLTMQAAKDIALSDEITVEAAFTKMITEGLRSLNEQLIVEGD